MNSDYRVKAWNNQIATKIYHLIQTEEVNYASGIASKIGSNSQTVKNYLQGLENQGLINEKGRKRGKILYEANTEDLVDNWYDVIVDKLKDKSENEKLSEDYREKCEEVLNELQDQETRLEIVSFIESYLDELMAEVNNEDLNQSLEELFLYELSFNVLRTTYETSKAKEKKWFKTLYKAVIYTNLNSWSLTIFEDVLEDW